MATKPTTASPWHTGNALREMAEAGRLNAEAISTELGIASATLYRWYRQRRLPQRALKKVAMHFGVNEEWLDSGKGPRHSGAKGSQASTERRVERLMLLYEAELRRATKRYTIQLTEALTGVKVMGEA